MYKHLFLLLCLLQATVTFGSDKEIPVQSKIKEVTVFLRGAQVTREATVTVNPGTTVFKFEELSPGINKNSIQVEGDKKFTILSVNHQMNYLKKVDKTAEIKKVDQQLEELKFKKKMRQNLKEVYQEEKKMLIENKSIKGEAKALNIEDLMEMADFYRARLQEVEMKLLEINRDVKKIDEQIQKLNNQRYELSSEGQKNTSEIIVHVSSKVKTSAKIKVRFMVNQAGWVPVYDVRSDDINGPVELSYKAKVYQNTGYDWDKVMLHLNTGNPTVSGTQPSVEPWVLSMYDPIQDAKRRERYREEAEKKKQAEGRAIQSNSAYTVTTTTSSDGSVAANPQGGAPGYTYGWDDRSTADYTNMTESNVSTEFKIKVPYSIKTDGKKYDVEVARHDLPVNYSYYSVPKIDDDAFLIARVSGWDAYNLLPGTANIYYQDTYVGNSFLDTRSTLDTLDISLGRDQGIIIERKKVKDFSKTTTVGNNKKTSLGIEINIRNNKSSVVELSLEDQIPVSSRKEIVVEVIDDGGATIEEETGKLKWNVKLKPGQSVKYTFTYSVKYPKNKPLANF